MGKKNNEPLASSPSPSEQPGLSIEIEVRGGYIRSVKGSGYWTLPAGVEVNVFAYSKKFHEALLEPDDQDGTLCKWTKYLGPPCQEGEEVKKVRIYIREGEIFKVIMPPESVVEVWNYNKDGEDPHVRRWVRKKKM